jgi:hypothetical protein
MVEFLENVRLRLLAIIATGFIAALAMGGTAVAITGTEFLYSSTKTGFLSIHPMDLAPDSNNAQYSNDYLFPTLFAANVSCYSTGVNLPHGSRITQLAVWYSSPAGSDPVVLFVRNNLANGTSDSLITSGSIFNDSNTRKLAVLPLAGGSSVVGNAGFSYGFGICPGVNGSFRGARITYTYTNAGD